MNKISYGYESNGYKKWTQNKEDICCGKPLWGCYILPEKVIPVRKNADSLTGEEWENTINVSKQNQ